MNSSYVPFQTPNLVWDSTIAIYLFLLGVASGTTLLAVLYKRRHPSISPYDSRIIMGTAFIAPLSVIVGLLLLIFHLTKPWTFWYLMFNYQFNSVMSMGVLMFQVYMAVIFLWIAVVFRDWIAKIITQRIPRAYFVITFIDFAKKFTNGIELFLLFLALVLGAYTGFLLSALISYPMLNNPLLPILFVVSGLSSGIATLVIAVLLSKKNATSTGELHFLHQFELPTVSAEIVLIFSFFVGLYFGGGQKSLSAAQALSGFWGNVFWIGVVVIGILFPLCANQLAGQKLRHQKAFMLLISCATLVGVLCLRYFILYAGQLTIA